MKTNKIKIEYDTTSEDFVDIVTGILDNLGVKYEKIDEDEDVIIIKYWIK